MIVKKRPYSYHFNQTGSLVYMYLEIKKKNYYTVIITLILGNPMSTQWNILLFYSNEPCM